MATTCQTGSRPSGATRKSHKSSGSRPTTPKHKKTTVEVVSESEDDMTTSFLHFCATCETQITMPASTLYCSESCRQKDANSSMSSYAMPSSNPTSPNHSPPFGPVRDIIPQRSPTLRHLSSPFLTGLPTTTSTSSSLSSSSSSSSLRRASQQVTHIRAARSHQDSEAARYLRQFSSTNLSKSSDHQSSRHYTRHKRNATTSTSTIPSLSHTPDSNASSFAPHSPPAASSARRPSLPHRSSNLTFSKRKSIDLVTPVSALHPATNSYFPDPKHHDDSSPTSTGSERTITFSSLNLKSTPTTAQTVHEPPSGDKGRTTPSEDESLEWMLQPAPKKRGPGAGAPGDAAGTPHDSAQGSLKQFFRFDQMRRAPHS